MRLISGCLTVVLLAVTAVAQTASAPAPATQSNEHGFNRLAHELNLTDQQRTDIQKLMQDERMQTETIRGNATLTPQQKREKVHELRQSTHDQMMAQLTPEQKQQFEQRHGPKHEPGVGPLAQLGLTPEQTAKIQPIIDSSREQTRALRTQTTLTPDQRHAKMNEIRQNMNSQIQTVLTPTQRQQLEQMRQRRAPANQAATPASPSGL